MMDMETHPNPPCPLDFSGNSFSVKVHFKNLSFTPLMQSSLEPSWQWMWHGPKMEI